MTDYITAKSIYLEKVMILNTKAEGIHVIRKSLIRGYRISYDQLGNKIICVFLGDTGGVVVHESELHKLEEMFGVYHE